MGAVTWKQLGQPDLRTFDDTAKKLVLKAMELGGTGRISSKGHAILRSPSGQTLSVARSLGRGNRSRQNTVAAFNRAFGPFEEDCEVSDSVPENTRSLSVVHDEPSNGVGDEEPTLECPADGCEAVFVTEGGRYTHVTEKHDRCTEPGCMFVAKNKTGRMAHERAVHQGFAARKGTGRTQKMEAALRAVVEALPPEYLPANERVAELEKENEALRKQVEDLEAKIALIKEGLGL